MLPRSLRKRAPFLRVEFCPFPVPEQFSRLFRKSVCAKLKRNARSRDANGRRMLALTRFLHANRYPPRIGSGGRLSLENAMTDAAISSNGAAGSRNRSGGGSSRNDRRGGSRSDAAHSHTRDADSRSRHDSRSGRERAHL